MRASILVFALFGLSACATRDVVIEQPQRGAVVTEQLPPMKSFGAAHVDPPARPNPDMARDFLDLSFEMESGRLLPYMTRFEGPITIGLAGSVPPTAHPDLDRLLHRFRSEAGLDVHLAAAGTEPNITIEFLPRATMQALVPQAACFVAPRVTSWEQFRRARNTALVDWSTLRVRERLAIFIPNDTGPQEIRDCLNEEIAQAMGPLNDLYRLPDSVFNDDNFNNILTGFDMLMLRVYYAPELHSGTTRAEAAAKLPALLARLNPAGERPGGPVPTPTPRAWKDAIETALGPGSSESARHAAAERAVAIASGQGWTDARMAFSWFALGRLAFSDETERAVTSLAEAARLYRKLPGTAVHLAHIDMQMAAFALSAGQPEEALRLVDRDLPAVTRAENAALLATLLMMKSEALAMLGRVSEARSARLDSLGWARYGFGSDELVRARMAEIAALAPPTASKG